MATGKTKTKHSTKCAAPEARIPQASQEAHGFSIVGIGAPAGGLEAFEQFFRKVSPAIGHHKMRLNARRIVSNTGDTQLTLLAMESMHE
ncbi:MAG: hypothetical protein WAW87_07510 [Candidatus Ferrigenium altingense]